MPQFMSSMFHQFSQQCGHHITLTCSSGKVKVMVKFTKILSKYHGVGNILTKISSVRHYCNTGTLLSTEMAYPHYYTTPSYRVLIRNRCFLHHCVPAFIPLSTQHQLTSQQTPIPEQVPRPC